ncbi:MAG TPA: dephospho-CoA kinase [Actinomycetes bacterium]|nr:dephospho-CoA kinase [Actinomycetes bacterium]
MTLQVGLTGGIGSGKSEVTRLLGAEGAVVVDSDVLAREAVARGTPGLAAVVDEFGGGVLAPDGSLDRPALGRVVFADPARRAALEAIVHPYVRRRSAEIAHAAPPGAVVVHDVPLLVEKDLQRLYDLVVVVDADEETQVRRLVGHRGMSEADARARVAAQAPRERRLAAADLVVANDGDLARLRDRVAVLWAELVRRGGEGNRDRVAGVPPA